MINFGIIASAYVEPIEEGVLHASFLGVHTDLESKSTYTFDDISFGSPVANRDIVVAVMTYDTSATDIDAVLVNGVSATYVAGATVAHETGLYYAPAPSGDIGTIIVEINPALPPNLVYIAVWRVTGGISGVADFDNVTGSPSSISTNVVGVENGVIISYVSNPNGNTTPATNWASPMVEDFDFRSGEVNMNITGATSSDPGATTVTASNLSSGFKIMVTGAFAP